MMENFEKIRQKSHNVVLEILPNVSPEELVDDKDLFSLGLDSITAMTLLLSLQDVFCVTFETADISFENFRTLANIVELIAGKKGLHIPV